MELAKRIVALDIGTVRIGVAVSDPLGVFAQGVVVLRAEGAWLEELADIVARYEAGAILVGMPRRTDGTDGPEVRRMKRVAQDVRERFPSQEVLFWDERFTTMIAQQALLEADVSRQGRREHVDKIAATLLLQNYLDARRTASDGISAPEIPPEAPVEAPQRAQNRRRGRGRYD